MGSFINSRTGLIIAIIATIIGLASLGASLAYIGNKGSDSQPRSVKQATPVVTHAVIDTSPQVSPISNVVSTPTSSSSPAPKPQPANTIPPVETGISREQAGQLIPLHPSQVTVTTTAGTAAVKWRGTGEDVNQYEVYRKTANDVDWQQLAGVKPVGDNRGLYEWKDTTIKPGTTYTYGVLAVGIYGKKSIIAQSTAIIAQ